MKKVTLTVTNRQGASVQFDGTSKADALRNFEREYDITHFRKMGCKFTYRNSITGEDI